MMIRLKRRQVPRRRQIKVAAKMKARVAVNLILVKIERRKHLQRKQHQLRKQLRLKKIVPRPLIVAVALIEFERGVRGLGIKFLMCEICLPQ